MSATGTAPRARLDLRHGSRRVFAHVVASALVVSVVNFTVWFAVTFWVYLEMARVTLPVMRPRSRSATTVICAEPRST